VCSGNGLSLLGRNWLQEVKLNWPEIAKINGVIKCNTSAVEKLLTTYSDVFKPELGHCQGIKTKLYVKEGAVPKFNCP